MNRHSYRRLLLLSTMHKILSGFLLNRTKPYSKDIIGDYECGFMSGKWTIDLISTVKQLVEKYCEFDEELNMLFVDYQQACDSVNNETLWDSHKE